MEHKYGSILLAGSASVTGSRNESKADRKTNIPRANMKTLTLLGLCLGALVSFSFGQTPTTSATPFRPTAPAPKPDAAVRAQITAATQCIAQMPQSAKCYADRGHYYHRASIIMSPNTVKARETIHQHPDRIAAIADLTRAISIEPANAEFYYIRGNIYAGSSRTDMLILAVKDYSKAIALNHSDLKAYRQRATVNRELKSYEDALVDYDVLMLRNSTDNSSTSRLQREWTMFGRASTYVEMGRSEDAIKAFSEIHAAFPSDPSALWQRGVLFHTSGNKAAAESDFRKVYAMSSDKAKVVKDLADRGIVLTGLSSAPSGPAPAGARVLFHDDFVDNRNGWDVGNLPGSMVNSIANGVYVVETNAVYSYAAWLNEEKAPNIDQGRDFTVEAKLKISRGDLVTPVGIFWGGDRKSNDKYYFGYFGNGRWNYGKNHSNGGWTEIACGLSDIVVKGEGGANILTAKKRGNTLELHINGDLVGRVPYERFPAGSTVGIASNQKKRLEVEYFKVTQDQ